MKTDSEMRELDENFTNSRDTPFTNFAAIKTEYGMHLDLAAFYRAGPSLVPRILVSVHAS